MQLRAMRLALLAACCAVVSANSAATNPITKVMQLMSGLQEQLQTEATKAGSDYDEFAEWGDDTAPPPANSQDHQDLGELETKLQAAQTDATQLNTDLTQVGSQVDSVAGAAFLFSLDHKKHVQKASRDNWFLKKVASKHGHKADRRTNPITKVMQLMEGLQTQLGAAAEKADAAYDEFAEWGDNQPEPAAGSDEATRVNSLDSQVSAVKADVDALARDLSAIDGLSEGVARASLAQVRSHK